METQGHNLDQCPQCGKPKLRNSTDCATCSNICVDSRAEYSVGDPYVGTVVEFESRDDLLKELCTKIFGVPPTYRNK
jgi:hypothetical protein